MRALLSRAPLNTDLGLLLVRLAVGFSMLVFHGWGKLTGGPEAWARVGGSMGNLGIGLWPEAWGLAAALAESLGSLLLILGLFTRPAAAVLAFTMVVAAVQHLNMPPEAANAGWKGASHALELLGVYLALLLVGPGAYAFTRGR